MQALILAGGRGTRLRPLTDTTPKPVLPLAGRPFLTLMLDWVAGHGVDEAILSCGFLGEEVERVLGHEHAGVRLRYVSEPEPLGTAGPVRLAAEQVSLAERLLVLNGDVLTDFDLSAEVAFHVEAGAAATLALVAVDDPTGYGLVPTHPDGSVEAFLEKAADDPGAGPPPTNRVNAGAYVLERSVVERIPPARAVSFEREIFPALVGAGLFGHAIDGYWIDIGTPDRYLEATGDLLSGRVSSRLPPRDERGSLVAAGCRVEGAEIGPLSALGDSCTVEPGARVVRSVLHRAGRVGAGAVVEDAVLAEGAVVGAGARVEGGAVVGAGARIEAGALVPPGARVAPGAVMAVDGAPPVRASAREQKAVAEPSATSREGG